jgi:uncharacterized protein with GYD domain
VPVPRYMIHGSYTREAIEGVLIADVPDNASAAAIGLGVGAAGRARTRTTVLMTTEEVDAASHKTVGYRPPGA